MEQKKILWIVAALGIFLLVIFLGTLIIYSPQQTTTPVIMSTDVHNDAWVNPNAMVANPLDSAQNKPSADSENVSPAQSLNQDTVVQTGDVTVISKGQTTVFSQDGITTIDLTAIDNSKAEAVVEEPSVRPITTRLPSSTTSEQKEVTTKKETEAAPKVANEKSSAPIKPVDQYWVQAASFVSKANADKARAALVEQKIPAEVFTHSNEDGVTFFRVRVGPYTTKSEAEYWNTLIKTVDNFTDAKSYVTNTAKPAR